MPNHQFVDVQGVAARRAGLGELQGHRVDRMGHADAVAVHACSEASGAHGVGTASAADPVEAGLGEGSDQAGCEQVIMHIDRGCHGWAPSLWARVQAATMASMPSR